MKTDNPPLDEIFGKAAELVGDDREAYLDHACAGDAALRGEAQKLLAAQSRAEQFLERAPGLPLATGADESVSEQVGTVIGPYKLLQQIGEGGFTHVGQISAVAEIQRRETRHVLQAAHIGQTKAVRQVDLTFS